MQLGNYKKIRQCKQCDTALDLSLRCAWTNHCVLGFLKPANMIMNQFWYTVEFWQCNVYVDVIYIGAFARQTIRVSYFVQQETFWRGLFM